MFTDLECVQPDGQVIFDRLHLTAFHDSPLGYTILGPVENIQPRAQRELKVDRQLVAGLRSITQEHLREYVKENYLAERIVRNSDSDIVSAGCWTCPSLLHRRQGFDVMGTVDRLI